MFSRLGSTLAFSAGLTMGLALTSACGPRAPLKASAVMGQWESECIPARPLLGVDPTVDSQHHMRHRMRFEGMTFTQERTLYSDADCVAPLETLERTGRIRTTGPDTVASGTTRLELKPEHEFITPHTDSDAESLDTERPGACGFGSWRAEQRVEVTPCGLDTGEGSRIYTVFQVADVATGGTSPNHELYFGRLTHGRNGTRPGLRPIQLDMTLPLHRPSGRVATQGVVQQDFQSVEVESEPAHGP